MTNLLPPGPHAVFAFVRATGLTLLALAAVCVVSAQTPIPRAEGGKGKTGPRAPFNFFPEPATEPSAIQGLPDFKVELLYTVPKTDQGSWVCLTVDPKGRLIASDQFGGLYRLTVPPPGTSTGTKIESITTAITGAHGLLYAFDSLYAMVSEGRTKGLYRLRDTNGDDQFDEVKLLCSLKGIGEHGPHGLVLGPDGKSIYFANGNHTDLPANLTKKSPVAWGEDHLLPRMWDATGHAKGRLAPGGYVGRTDSEGRTMELLSIGFRNQYDLAFDQNGELFTGDSDTETDQGSPWYVPTRINHVVDGGEYGWRSGAGRWPEYYVDSLPATLDIGPGSPTGMTFGTHARFPAPYQRALFVCDWTYGTLYAFHLTPDGASFRGEKEEFLTGKPLPLTDVIISPHDGAMYFVVGGRRTQSALYRVSYHGAAGTAPAKIPAPTAAAQLRHSLEALHVIGTGLDAIDTAWPHLASPDRWIRFAARVAIEQQPAAGWVGRALAEPRPLAAIEALIALARVGDKSLQPRLIESLDRLDFAAQPAALQLPLLRAWHLVFTRMGRPAPGICAGLAARFDHVFPHADPFVNRELAAILIYLDSPTVVAKTVPLLSVAETPGTAPEETASPALLKRNARFGTVVEAVAASRSDRQQIAFAYALRNAKVGWTAQLRREYFSWFPRTRTWRGGNSFTGFLKNIRTEALAQVSDLAERAALDDLSKVPVHSLVAGAVSPKGPGQTYTVKDAVALVGPGLRERDFAQGKAMFTATACVLCHRFNTEGSGLGPDLSGSGSRYSIRDLLENIIEPSLVISDQFGSEQIERREGEPIIGRVVGEENGELFVMTNPFMPDEQTRVRLSAVKSRQPFPISMMPPGLINALNPDEMKDLLAYILSGGQAGDAMFKQ